MDIMKHPDFKFFYCKKSKGIYWLLGYFGGGSYNIKDSLDVAKQYAEINNVKLDTIYIDEIFKSRRWKGFKIMWSSDKKEINELNSFYDIDIVESVWDDFNW